MRLWIAKILNPCVDQQCNREQNEDAKKNDNHIHWLLTLRHSIIRLRNCISFTIIWKTSYNCTEDERSTRVDWSQLFSMQKQLDTYIEHNHNREPTDLFHEKYVALLVEIGELANE